MTVIEVTLVVAVFILAYWVGDLAARLRVQSTLLDNICMYLVKQWDEERKRHKQQTEEGEEWKHGTTNEEDDE